MNHWPFIWASYLVTLGGALALAFQSYAALRSAERMLATIGDAG
ncbi:heme exporter protein CcmD [Sphingorhabdus sp.]